MQDKRIIPLTRSMEKNRQALRVLEAVKAGKKGNRPVNEVKVNGLLEESLKLHYQAQAKGKLIPRPANWKSLLLQARKLRIEADELDPSHTSEGWVKEQAKTPTGHDTHRMLTEFYNVVLGL